MAQKSKIIVVIMALLIFCGCTPSNNDIMKNEINAFVVENSTRWANTVEVDTTNCKALDLYMLNNPYHFNNNRILLYFGDRIIYKGDFKQKLRVYISKGNFGKRVMPGMQVFQGTTEYNFIQKTSIFLSEGDQFLYIVFCPDNDLVGSCYLFSQKEEIL
jgi:hypothetical protein